jgi:TRAP-type mannitol/chloroaromatic compound transport system substrate-binding protein
MATSWPRNLPGPGVSARRIADTLFRLSDGAFAIEVAAAGEVVPAFEVLDAVSSGAVEAGHSAAFFWQGKMPAASLFTTMPFGLLPIEHHAWLLHGGGLALWRDLYRAFNVVPFVGGNTGPSLGGWFRRPITRKDDVRGLKMRVQGMGAEVWRRLGATPVAIPPGDISAALSSGTVDAVEFLAPSNDLAIGLPRAASHCALGGFTKPNGVSEFLVNAAAYAALPAQFRAMLDAVTEAEHALGLADAEQANAAALTRLQQDGRTTFMTFPSDLLTAARQFSAEVMADIAGRDALSARCVESYREHLQRVEGQRLQLKATLGSLSG